MNLATLDLNLLLVLHTVLSERSVARAAQRLNVTSPAISNALARLRVALDDPLTIRSARGIAPTPRAAALAPVLARTLGELGDAVRGEPFDPTHSELEFSLAAADVIQLTRVPRLVALMAKEMPRARLRVLSVDTLHANGGLAGSSVDVAIGAGERAPGVHAEPLYDERIVLVMRRAHPHAKATISKQTLADLRHVEVHVAPGMPNRGLASSYAAAGVRREIATVVPSYMAAATIAAGTDLVASLPATLLEVLAPRLGLRSVHCAIRPISTPIRVLYHERTARDPAQRAFRELIQRA